MPRKFFRRVSRRYPRNQPHAFLGPFRNLLHHPLYFAANRRSVTGGLWVGLFIGLLPLPGHIILAVVWALILRVNLPVAAVSVWVSNPLTFLPICYFEYRLGAMILQVPVRNIHIELAWRWLTHGLIEIWKPFLLGAFVSATVGATLAYVAVNLLWRQSTISRYRKRRKPSG